MTSLLVEESFIDGNGGMGIWVDNRTDNVTIRSSTISNNGGQGIHFYKCIGCVIENSTVFNNATGGVHIQASMSGPNQSVVINNSTIHSNGGTTQANLMVSFMDTLSELILNNSIVTNAPGAQPVCSWLASPYLDDRIVASNSIFSDTSCRPRGSGNLIADPLLSSLGNFGGFSPTLLPLSGSPAIDGGQSSSCPAQDQRGLPRPIDKLGRGPLCDIGAVEIQ